MSVGNIRAYWLR